MRVDQNRRFYERRGIGARYATQSQLQPAEAEIFARYRADISGGRILDLGVGGGRTTPFLLELSSDYIGVDYSPPMIERCRRRYPGVSFEVADARDLSRFPDASFDFVFFSYNGIDAVGHEGRLRILSEVHRVLRGGGLFVFSSHNRNFPVPKPWDLANIAINPLRHPIRFGKRAAAYPLGISNYMRFAGRSEVLDEYCIFLDSAHRYSLLHYWISVASQKHQLERIGFGEVQPVGIDGQPLSPHEWERNEDPWIQYVCRRALGR